VRTDLTVVAPVSAVGAFSAVVVAVVALSDSAVVAVVPSPFIPTLHPRVIPVAAISSRLVVCTARNEWCHGSQKKGGYQQSHGSLVKNR
jgi:hypothetical protein